MNNLYDTRKWKELGATEKIKITVAAALVISAIILGFISFILLMEIPTSVIGLDGLWLSTALAVMGIASHFHNEMVKFENTVKTRLDSLDRIDQNIRDDDYELPNN